MDGCFHVSRRGNSGMRGKIPGYSTLDIPADQHRQIALPEADLDAQHLSDIVGTDKAFSL